MILLVGCPDTSPIKIGYLGGLTGRVSGLGVACRDGLLIAVEDINRQGGIHGRPIELVVRDDKQDAETAKQVMQELIDDGVVSLIGPMTSSIAVAIKPMIDQSGMVTISPTVTAERFSGQRDTFFRVITPLSANAKQLAAYTAGTLGLKRFVVVRDDGNRAFTENWQQAFSNAFQELGGEVIAVIPYISAPDVSFLDIAEMVTASEPDAVLILSGAMDAALLSQQLYKLGASMPLFGSEWAFTSDVISFGGGAVEGMTGFLSYHVASERADYLLFKQKFEERFGYPPSFASILAHDAASLLFRALERNPDTEVLNQTLLSIGEFSGLQSDIRIDQFGDVDRPLFKTRIKNGRFEVVE